MGVLAHSNKIFVAILARASGPSLKSLPGTRCAHHFSEVIGLEALGGYS